MLSWLIPSVLGAVGTILATVGAVMVARSRKPGELENTRIDQFQEDLEAERRERHLLQAQVTKLAAQLATLVHRDYLWDFHVTRLEAQVRELGGTPFARPEGLQPLPREQED